MSADKLNKVLATNIPMKIWLKKRAGEYDDKYKPGAKNYMYIFEDDKAVEYVHYASETQQETLILFAEGDALQVVRKEEQGKDGMTYKMYLFTPQEGAEAQLAATPKVMSNSAVKKAEDSHASIEKQRAVKDRYIALAGWGQAALRTFYGEIKTPDSILDQDREALVDFAEDMVARTLQRAGE